MSSNVPSSVRRRARHVRLRPTGERCIKIRLPAAQWDRAQELIRATRSQSFSADESSRRMLELLRPYCPPGFTFNPRTDTIELLRDRRVQVGAGGAP